MRFVALFCLLAAATAVPVHLHNMQSSVVHPQLESLMEEAARVSMRAQTKMLKPVMEVVKGKVDGKDSEVEKALAVKVHRFELATAITLLSQGMKVAGETWSHQKENLVFPIELLGRLLVFAHDVFNADPKNQQELGGDLGGWICDLFQMPGGTLRDDDKGGWERLVKWNTFKTGYFPPVAEYAGKDKAARKALSLQIIKNLLNPDDPDTNHRTLYYMLSKLTEAGEDVIGDGAAGFGSDGVAGRRRWDQEFGVLSKEAEDAFKQQHPGGDVEAERKRYKQECEAALKAAKAKKKKNASKDPKVKKCWTKKAAKDNDKNCFRWTVIALHEKKLAAPQTFNSGFSMATLSNMYRTLKKCKMTDGNTKKKNVLAPACDDWMQNARPASKCPFHLIKAFAIIQKSSSPKKAAALKILGDYLANGDKGWFRYKPGNKCGEAGKEGKKLKEDVLAALKDDPLAATLSNGLFKDEKDGFKALTTPKPSNLGALLKSIGDVAMSRKESEARGDDLWGIGGTAWYMPKDEWDLQYNGKPLLSPRFRRFMKNYIVGNGMLSSAGPSGTSAEMETLGEYFGLSNSAFWQCKAFESLLAQMVMYNHHSYIEVQEAITRMGPGKTENDPEVVIDVHKDRANIIDMHPNGDEATKLDDPFAILKRCDQHLSVDTVKPINVKFDTHNLPNGVDAAKNEPVVASTAVWPHVVKMFHKLSNGGDEIFKKLAAAENMPFNMRMNDTPEGQKNLWKITVEGAGKGVIESKVCAIPDFAGTAWETVFHCAGAQQQTGHVQEQQTGGTGQQQKKPKVKGQQQKQKRRQRRK